MGIPSKVLWSAGLTVGPQHLQQLDRYHETRLQQMALSIHPCIWGAPGGMEH